MAELGELLQAGSWALSWQVTASVGLVGSRDGDAEAQGRPFSPWRWCRCCGPVQALEEDGVPMPAVLVTSSPPWPARASPPAPPGPWSPCPGLPACMLHSGPSCSSLGLSPHGSLPSVMFIRLRALLPSGVGRGGSPERLGPRRQGHVQRGRPRSEASRRSRPLSSEGWPRLPSGALVAHCVWS